MLELCFLTFQKEHERPTWTRASALKSFDLSGANTLILRSVRRCKMTFWRSIRIHFLSLVTNTSMCRRFVGRQLVLIRIRSAVIPGLRPFCGAAAAKELGL